MILRCTTKVLSLLGARASALQSQQPDGDDWYLNLIWIERRKCLLLVQARTLFSAFAVGMVLAKTTSRSVLGYMNEMARFCEYTAAGGGGIRRCDIDTLNRELRRELHLSRDAPGYIVPIEQVKGKTTAPSNRILWIQR